ncbi:MAG: phosphonate ABC transporter, permease protein PhnE, partial [Alphaproteobacteria bacterium]
MTVAAPAAAASPPISFAEARRYLHRNVQIAGAVLAAILAYLAYSWVAFDAPSVIARADPERAVLLGVDAVAHKTHVVKDLRRGGIEVAIEGERTATYETPPAWVSVDGDDAVVDLGDGYSVKIVGGTATFAVPDYGDIVVSVGPGGVQAAFPGPAPDWARATAAKFDARPTLFKRLQVSRSKIEIHRYAYGWENFFFPFRSALNAYSAGELLDLALSDDRIDPDRSNAALIAKTFLDNPDWQHREVLSALFETIMM